MPKLWNETIEAHRHTVRDAILDTTAAMVAERGPASVKMSHIAEEAGIGRATLYKYFPDVDAILAAWHERQVTRHLKQLAAVRDEVDGAVRQLEAVLQAYALISHERHGHELAPLVHRGEHLAHAHQQLQHLVRDLVAEGAKAGDLRDDVDAEELAAYCLHALTAAGGLHSKAAVQRLVKVILAGLRPS